MNKSERMAEDELRLNRPEMTPTERFRALRGVVIHLLRPGPPKLAPGVQVGHRSIAPRLGAPQPKLVWNERAGKYVWVPGETRTGRCVWCLQPVPNKRFRWHQACNVYYALAEGRSRDGLGPPNTSGEAVPMRSAGRAARPPAEPRACAAWRLADVRESVLPAESRVVVPWVSQDENGRGSSCAAYGGANEGTRWRLACTARSADGAYRPRVTRRTMVGASSAMLGMGSRSGRRTWTRGSPEQKERLEWPSDHATYE